ncbi:F-actin-monooxygenase MICAL2 isoform X4 [Monodelphis domestica]|uniref:F-actin-monooxygenase MICAL2 isoform X4 n=1 Tax=Monodelphis domestica TaxID=13616 RepID=UPI0024E1A030|nr:F-actin-monooxygenase MICAL2 isoform X4 [Monodelphis domestica]
MGENEDEKQSQAGQIFENFVQASTCKGTLQAFNILIRHLQLDPSDHRNFYSKLKSKVTTWKAKALWNKLDKRGTHKEYKRGKSCMNTRCLVVGGGPCGLRTAIELAYLGAKVVVVEKRDTFSRNNVLHLWPFTIHDLRGLGAKKFYGKFCAGSIDHISIRQLQLILFKVALMLGVEIHVNIEFVKVLEPPEDQENQKVGWRAEILPADHSLSDFEFDVIIGADGRRNTLEGFRRKEFRGKLAIAITANFINRNTTAEAKVEEISGVAFIFNQKFFQDLKEETGIDLENIVYYKDSTHYFVMTAKKQSLLDKGVIVNDYIDTELLLGSENVNQDCLLSYAREAADFATNYQLPSLDFAMNHYGQPDVAMFDFTSMYASENAALVRERQSHQLLVALVGDSLLEPFWPMGTGCARGFLAAFDTAWMVKSWEQGIPPLEILAERESLYRLLPQTTPENISKNFEQYTLDPGTRYPNLNSNCVRPHQVKHLYITTELHHLPLERFGSIRRSVSLSRRESDIRPNKLLTWCQKQTEGYQHVSVTDLTTSWRSGLALCALIHRFRPELINFDSLNEEDAIENNQLAFDIAEREFGIPPMTTGKEMASSQEPDKLSLVMYLSKFYELFRGTPLRAVDSLGKNYGENGDLSLAKSSIFNNYLNLTFPRKRTPRVENLTEENDMNKRRRKGLDNLEEPSSFSSRSIGSSREYGISREGMNQNKVKSMANQLLAKFEENARNPSFLRQEQALSNLGKPVLHSSAGPPVNSHFAKPEDPTPSPSPPLKRQFQALAKTEQVLREAKQASASDCLTRPSRARAKSDLQHPQAGSMAPLPSAYPGAFALVGALRRLQNVEEKIHQKRAQNLANREFHKKNIKEKAAHLASMFASEDFPQNKLLTKGLSHPPSLPSSCLSSRDSTDTSFSSSVDSSSSDRKSFVPGAPGKPNPAPKKAYKQKLFQPDPGQMTVGKVSRGIGAVAEVLVNLYMNDHRPKTQAASPDRRKAMDQTSLPLNSSISPTGASPGWNHQGSLRKEFPQNLGGSDICYFCKRRVYVMERLSAEGHFFHRECFRCEVCSTTLRLAAYAFDADEGKFYCKTHFIHCRTNSKQRKRRAELKRQEEEEAQEKQQEVKWSDPSPEILGPAVNSREASPPDEPTSPKKPKSISGPCDADGQRGLFPAEWTSVKIGPKGEGNEDDVLAICVMVTSDGSSSETESDSGDNSSQMQFSEQKTLKSQQLPCPKPFRRQVSLTVPQNRRPGTGCPEESKVANALHRAHSFQHPTSNKYQNGRRKCQSNLTSPNSKKSVLSSKDPPYSSSAPGPGKPSGDVPLPQATYTTSPEIKRRHSQPQSPIIQGRVRMREVCKEIPLYIPHRFQKEDSSSTHGPGDVGMKLANGHWKTKTIPWKTGNTRDGPDHVGVEPRSRPSLSLTSEKSQGNTTIGSKTEENELKSNEGRKQCLKKLALTQEQKSQLLDWNDANAENLSLDTGELMHAGNERGETSKLSNLSSFPGPAKEALSHQRETPQESCGPTPRATREGAVNRPKSPLRLIANAIRKSLEPLLSNPEGGKKNSDSRPKTLMENLSLNGPQPCDQSPNLKKTSYSKNCDVQKPTLSSLLVPGNERGTSDSAISLHVAPEAQPVTRGLSDRVARARSLPSRQKRSMTLPSAIVEDSSTLLDKVNLKEVLLGKSLDQYKALTKKGSLFSSFRLKEKTYESLGSMKTRKDLGSIFSNPGAKDICYTPKKPSEPWNKSSSGQMDILLPGENLSSMHLPVRAQMTECYSSFSSSDTTSSSDGEFEPQPSLPPKERRTLKRIRKMEKASKQLAKQEEFKRLYKAQAIQRQLEEVEERQRASEIQGVELEKALRGESDSGAQDEARLLHEWFKLVLEKNKLMRYESELLIMAQELELEDHQSRLEQKLREKMCMEESEKDDSIRNEEQEIFTKMMRVIEQRDRLVDSLEEQRVKEKAEDQHFENFMLSRAYQLSRS